MPCKIIPFKPQHSPEPLAFDGQAPGPVTDRDVLRKIHAGVALWCLPRLEEAVTAHKAGASSAWVLVEAVRQYLQNMTNSLNTLED